MAQSKAKAQPGAGPVYEIRKGGVVCCTSTLFNCGYSPQELKQLRDAGFDLYEDGKKVKRSKA